MKKSISLSLIILVTYFAVNAQYIKLFDFDSIDGTNPRGSLFYDGALLYGFTPSGGTDGLGVTFKIKPDGTSYSKLLNFASGSNGRNPIDSPISGGTFLYGMTSAGGTGNCGTGFGCGVIFKVKPDGTAYSKLFDFGPYNGPNGTYPSGSLIYDGTFLYGMTASAGINGYGTIFKIKPDGTGFAKLLDFGSLEGTPSGSLISDGIFIYGMTTGSCVSESCGTIFKIKPDGTAYSILHYFSGYPTDGSAPKGSLISDGTFLYGMTRQGGTNNVGIVFKIMQDGTGYTKLLDFSGGGIINGFSPLGSLIYDGTFLYGMTVYGGANNLGIIFKIKPDGTGGIKLYDFTGVASGSNPFGTLISDGNFLYGMTVYGGANNLGTIFKYALVADIDENSKAISFNMFPNPANDFIDVETNFKNCTVSVFDNLGKLVLKEKIYQNKKRFNLSDFSNGLYFITLQVDDKTVSKKFIKQ